MGVQFMDGSFSDRRVAVPLRLQLPPDRRSISAVLLFFMLSGVLLGGILGRYSSISFERFCFFPFLTGDPDSLSAFLLRCLFPFALLLLVSGSYFGVAFSPLFLLLFGFQFGYYVARQLIVFSMQAYAYLFFRYGVEALLLIPPVVLFSADCFSASRSLVALRFRHAGALVSPEIPISHWLFLAIACFGAVCYHTLVFPLILNGIAFLFQ